MDNPRNASARDVNPEVWAVLQGIRKENDFKNHNQVLEFLTKHYVATKGKKPSKPAPEPVPSKPPTGDGYFTVKLNSRDVEPLQKVRDYLFEKNMENDSQALRYMVRQQVHLIDGKIHVVKLPETANEKLMKFYEKGRKRGAYRDTSDAFHALVKIADHYDEL